MFTIFIRDCIMHISVCLLITCCVCNAMNSCLPIKAFEKKKKNCLSKLPSTVTGKVACIRCHWLEQYNYHITWISEKYPYIIMMDGWMMSGWGGGSMDGWMDVMSSAITLGPSYWCLSVVKASPPGSWLPGRVLPPALGWCGGLLQGGSLNLALAGLTKLQSYNTKTWSLEFRFNLNLYL